MTNIQIHQGDSYFDAYLARPDGPPKAGIVVIQEIFGVNADIRATADWLASEGYLALAPDLFWRQTRNVAMDRPTDEQMQQAFKLMSDYDADQGVGDIEAALDYLRDPALGGGCAKVATLGFCLGGRMVYLAACRTDGDAHASYYGVGIQAALNEAENIAAPTLIHIAGNDAFVPVEAQAAIADGLAEHPYAQVHIYAQQDHGFARNSGEHHDVAATKLAHGRTLEMFEHMLRDGPR